MMGRDGSGNVPSPRMTLKLNLLLQNFPSNQRQNEEGRVGDLITRNISNLRQLYNFYCKIGHDRVQSTKSEMTRLQFWRFIKDSHIHHYELSLPEMDRIIAPCLEKRNLHHPLERFSFSDFLSSLVILAYVIFRDKISLKTTKANGTKEKQRHPGAQGGRTPQRSHLSVLYSCLEKLLSEHILMHSGIVKGGFLFDTRRYINALKYMESSWKIHSSICDQSKREPTLVMRKLLLSLSDLQIVGPRLPAEKFIKILASDHPRVCQDGGYNLEIEICFLEYFEALIACAGSFVDEDMMKQNHQSPHQGSMHVKKFRKGASSAGTGIGHSRPGSSYSRRTSARSLKSASSRTSSIPSIEEDDSPNTSEASTLQASKDGGPSQGIDESTETAVESLKELNINDDTVEQVDDQRVSPQGIDMSSILAELEEERKLAQATSPRARRRTPEVMTAEMERKEKEFSAWSTKLHIFFTKHLIPAWERFNILRREAARHRSRDPAS